MQNELQNEIDGARNAWMAAKTALKEARAAVLSASGPDLKKAQEAFIDAYYLEQSARSILEALMAEVKIDDLSSGEFRRPFAVAG